MTDQRRGKRLALIGVFLQTAFSVVALAVWLWTDSDAAMATMWFLVAGVPLWLMVAVLFYCRQLAARESDELEEISAHGGAQGTIFERAESLEQRPAAKRLAWMEKWMAPAFTLFWAALQVTGAVFLERSLLRGAAAGLSSAGEAAVFFIALAMAAFLFSYYCLGLSREPRWRLHRATGSYLLVCSLALLASAAGMLVAYWKQYYRFDDFVAYVIPAVQIVLSVELVLNFILDLYRPRLPGQEHRFSFDSRLFNVLAEPGKVGHSIAETMNYQFGFEVSKTWFYLLISRAMVPLLLVGAAILLAMSCVVVVRDGESYVLRRWGSFPPDVAPLGPGVHTKWPWPVETVERFETGGVQQILLGVGRERSAEEARALDYAGSLEVFDWSKSHGQHEEENFLIAVPPVGKDKPPVNIIKLVVLVQYAIDDVYQYGYQFTEPRKMLECVADRELTQYFATATLDSPVEKGVGERPEAIMTYGRARAAAELKKRVQVEANQLNLGVRITFVGFQGVHPPPEAAAEFEAVLKAQRAMEQKRFEAEADAARILTRQAGSPSTALQLALAIQKRDAMDDLNGRRNDPADFDAKLHVYLRDANDRIAALAAEVEQERLEGRLRQDQATDKQELLKSYEDHQRTLAGLKGPADLSALVARDANEVDRLFRQASGDSVAIVSREEAYRWSKEMGGRGEWEAFGASLPAFRANPAVYKWDHWLGVWEEALPSIFKYVLTGDRSKMEVWLDWHREPSALESAFQENKKPEEKSK